MRQAQAAINAHLDYVQHWKDRQTAIQNEASPASV
jgi:hypothetical protein